MDRHRAPDSPEQPPGDPSETPGEDSDLASDAAIRAAEAFDPGEQLAAEPAPGRQAGRIARSTAFFSVATAASRIAGLVREIVAASGEIEENPPVAWYRQVKEPQQQLEEMWVASPGLEQDSARAIGGDEPIEPRQDPVWIR